MLKDIRRNNDGFKSFTFNVVSYFFSVLELILPYTIFLFAYRNTEDAFLLKVFAIVSIVHTQMYDSLLDASNQICVRCGELFEKNDKKKFAIHFYNIVITNIILLTFILFLFFLFGEYIIFEGENESIKRRAIFILFLSIPIYLFVLTSEFMFGLMFAQNKLDSILAITLVSKVFFLVSFYITVFIYDLKLIGLLIALTVFFFVKMLLCLHAFYTTIEADFIKLPKLKEMYPLFFSDFSFVISICLVEFIEQNRDILMLWLLCLRNDNNIFLSWVYTTNIANYSLIFCFAFGRCCCSYLAQAIGKGDPIEFLKLKKNLISWGIILITALNFFFILTLPIYPQFYTSEDKVNETIVINMIISILGNIAFMGSAFYRNILNLMGYHNLSLLISFVSVNVVFVFVSYLVVVVFRMNCPSLYLSYSVCMYIYFLSLFILDYLLKDSFLDKMEEEQKRVKPLCDYETNSVIV